MIQTQNIKDGAITNEKLGNASVKAQNVDFATINVTDTPRIIYYLNGKAVYRKYISGTTKSDSDETMITFDGEIVDFSVFALSRYHNWQKLGLRNNEDSYNSNISISEDRKTLRFSVHSYLQGQSYDGYVDFVK